MDDDSINLLLAIAALLAIALILALPAGCLRRLVRRQSGTPSHLPIGREYRLTCANCAQTSPPRARGWKAHLTAKGEPAFFCPGCAERPPQEEPTIGRDRAERTEPGL